MTQGMIVQWVRWDDVPSHDPIVPHAHTTNPSLIKVVGSAQVKTSIHIYTCVQTPNTKYLKMCQGCDIHFYL